VAVCATASFLLLLLDSQKPGLIADRIDWGGIALLGTIAVAFIRGIARRTGSVNEASQWLMGSFLFCLALWMILEVTVV
jgi:hypothetical protein